MVFNTNVINSLFLRETLSPGTFTYIQARSKIHKRSSNRAFGQNREWKERYWEYDTERKVL